MGNGERRAQEDGQPAKDRCRSIHRSSLRVHRSFPPQSVLRLRAAPPTRTPFSRTPPYARSGRRAPETCSVERPQCAGAASRPAAGGADLGGAPGGCVEGGDATGGRDRGHRASVWCWSTPTCATRRWPKGWRPSRCRVLAERAGGAEDGGGIVGARRRERAPLGGLCQQQPAHLQPPSRCGR